MVAATALMSGQFAGEPVAGDGRARAFKVPAMVGAPDPGCWVMRPGQPVSCSGVPTSAEDTRRVTSSYDYPPWAYVLPGLVAPVASPSNYAYLARLADALVPMLLVGAALASLRGAGRGGPALLVGLTPIAWFMFGTVNPSALAIAGGVALLAALIGRPDRVQIALAVAGWSAVVLARRDGPIYAALIVLGASVVRGQPPSAWWALLGRTGRVLVVGSAAFAFVWSIVRGNRLAEIVLAASPAGLIVADAAWRRWMRASTRGRMVIGAAGVAATVVALAAIATLRPRGYNSFHLRLIISATDDHLEGLVGVLGWLDTPSPQVVVILYWMLIGGLLLAALVDEPRTAAIGAGAVVTLIVAAWVLEFGQGGTTGTYWQGRYSLPFAVGLPLVAVWRSKRPLPRRIDVVLAVGFVLIVNGAFLAAQQRWAVGVFGSWRPWAWHTWGAPTDPLFLIVTHAVATSALAFVVVRAARPIGSTHGHERVAAAVAAG